jgi:hypothetical protein
LVAAQRPRVRGGLKRQWELNQATIQGGVPPSVLEACSRLDLERHRRNQFPVGAFFDSIDKRRHHGQKPTSEKLLAVAEVGKELLYEAICTADDDDNEEFFVQAYECWGPLVDTLLQECDREVSQLVYGIAPANSVRRIVPGHGNSPGENG